MQGGRNTNKTFAPQELPANLQKTQSQDNAWTEVKRKDKHKRTRPDPIQGSKSLNEPSPIDLKVAEKQSWLFVTGLSPDITVQEINAYLQSQGIDKSTIEKLKTRKDLYKSSFKICVLRNLRDTVMNSEFWPQGVSVNHFLNLQRRSEYLSKVHKK